MTNLTKKGPATRTSFKRARPNGYACTAVQFALEHDSPTSHWALMRHNTVLGHEVQPPCVLAWAEQRLKPRLERRKYGAN
eukprot:3650919-Amphidinium_carterae.3